MLREESLAIPRLPVGGVNVPHLAVIADMLLQAGDLLQLGVGVPDFAGKRVEQRGGLMRLCVQLFQR